MPFKKYLFGAIIVLVFLSLATNTSALGIGPSRVIYDFEPNMEKTVDYVIINDKDSIVDVEIYVRGDLADHVTLSKTFERIQPKERGYFTATIKLPATLDRPGTHDTRIGVVESAGGAMAATGPSVGARVGVEAQIWIEVPYPGKYVTANLIARNVGVNEPIEIDIELTSGGTEGVTVTGEVEIYDSSDNKILTLPMNSVTLTPEQKTATAKAIHTPGISNAGRYRVHADMAYDGKTLTADANFGVGTMVLNINKVYTDDRIRQGTITQIDTEVESIWNEDIENVYVSLEIKDLEGTIVAKPTSESVTFKSWTKNNMSTFWDTTNIETGTYTALVTLNYAGNTDVEQVTLEVSRGLRIGIEGGAMLYTIIIVILGIVSFFVYKIMKKRGII